MNLPDMLHSTSRTAARKCMKMSKAEWCANEESQALCGVSKKICLNLRVSFTRLRVKKVVSELISKRASAGTLS